LLNSFSKKIKSQLFPSTIAKRIITFVAVILCFAIIANRLVILIKKRQFYHYYTKDNKMESFLCIKSYSYLAFFEKMVTFCPKKALTIQTKLPLNFNSFKESITIKINY